MTNDSAITRDFDHYDGTIPADRVRAVYTEMRESWSVVHVDRYGGFEHLGRYEDVRAALTDPESFSSADGVFIPKSGLPPTPAMEFDEPEHSQWRAVLDPPLNPRAVRQLEPTLREVVDLLIDDFAGTGHVDLVPALAQPLPAIVIGRMIGLSQEEATTALPIADELFASIGSDTFPQRMAEFTDFVESHLEMRRREPRDDFLTELASGHAGGMDLDQEGVLGVLTAYLIGGHHSTSSGIAGLLHHLLTVPGLREAIDEDDKALRRGLEESLRIATPLHLFGRTAICPVTVGDQQIPAGSRVMLNFAAANRDPREFDEPDQFNWHRSPNRHLAFGAGIHVCPGQHLARAEMRIAASRLLERLPDIHITGEVQHSGLVGGCLMTILSLPATFTPTVI